MTAKSDPILRKAQTGEPTDNGGQFGTHDHSEPEATLGGSSVLGVVNVETEFVYIADEEGDYTPMTRSDAKARLGIDWTEPDEVLDGVLALLADTGSTPPFKEKDQRYSDPGDYAELDTSEWPRPADDRSRWNTLAAVWVADNDNGDIFVRNELMTDLTKLGFDASQSEIAEHVAYAYLRSEHRDIDDETVAVDGPGVLRVAVQEPFTAETFAPRYVAAKMDSAGRGMNVHPAFQDVILHGFVLHDSDLKAAKAVDTTTVAYAAAAGRTPTDAEACALALFLASTPIANQHHIRNLSFGFVQNRSELFAAIGQLQLGATKAKVTAAKALNVWLRAHHS